MAVLRPVFLLMRMDSELATIGKQMAAMAVEMREVRRRLGVLEVAIGSATITVTVSAAGVVMAVILRKAGLT